MINPRRGSTGPWARLDLPMSRALVTAGAWLRDMQNLEPVAVGHRVVHGGPDYDRPVLIDSKVLTDLERYVSLAPLHQPNNLAPVRVILARMPADHYAIPERLYAEGVRRYGFHGLSYEFIASRLPQVVPQIAAGRVIVAHLGSGASMCGLVGGRSIESTMGFTALDGLPMGTRPGQIDPGVVLYLVQKKAMSPAEVQDFLYEECGLKGLSGISNDVRELDASSDPRAQFALDYFAYRVGLQAGLLAAALGGVDGFVLGARFKGYTSFVVQDLVIRRHVVNFRCERWQMPDGSMMTVAPPDGIDGHFGPRLRRFVLANTIKGR